MSKKPPRVESIRDVRPLCEVFTLEDGHQVFSRSTFASVTDDCRIYFNKTPVRKLTLNLKNISDNLKLVPDAEVYPEAQPHITIVSRPIDGDLYYITRPKLTNYDVLKGTGLIPRLLLQKPRCWKFFCGNRTQVSSDIMLCC